MVVLCDRWCKRPAWVSVGRHNCFWQGHRIRLYYDTCIHHRKRYYLPNRSAPYKTGSPAPVENCSPNENTTTDLHRMADTRWGLNFRPLACLLRKWLYIMGQQSTASVNQYGNRRMASGAVRVRAGVSLAHIKYTGAEHPRQAVTGSTPRPS